MHSIDQVVIKRDATAISGRNPSITHKISINQIFCFDEIFNTRTGVQPTQVVDRATRKAIPAHVHSLHAVA